MKLCGALDLVKSSGCVSQAVEIVPLGLRFVCEGPIEGFPSIDLSHLDPAPRRAMPKIASARSGRLFGPGRVLSREVTARPPPVLRRPDRTPPRLPPFPGGEPETRTSVGRSTNRVRALTGIRIGSLAMPCRDAIGPIPAALHPIQHKVDHRLTHNHRKNEKMEQRHLVKMLFPNDSSTNSTAMNIHSYKIILTINTLA